jgi:hypothetical protein
MMQLVTIEDLDWTSVDEAARRGDLPQFTAILGECTVFRVRPDAPPSSCANWGTIATGTAPMHHGVTFPLEAWAGGLRRITRASWLKPPVWQMLADRGLSTASIAFPTAAPGSAWPGTHIDERILMIGGLAWDDWPLPLDVAPADLREELRSVRVHSADVQPELLAPFERGNTKAHRSQPREVAVALAQSSTFFSVAEIVARHVRPDFMALHVNWPRTFASALKSPVLPSEFWTLLDGGVSRLPSLAALDSSTIFVSPGSSRGPGFIAVYRAKGRPESSGWASLRDIVPTILGQYGFRDPSLHGNTLFRTEVPLPNITTEWSNSTPTLSAEDCDRVEAFGHGLPKLPADWPSPKLLAEAELSLESDPTVAAQKVAEALETSPRSPGARALAGLLAFVEERAEELEDHADALTDIDPDSLQTAMLRAGVHVLRRETRQATPLLQRIEREGNRDDRLKVAAAWLMLRRGTEAERVLDSILAEDPYCVPALLALASRKRTRLFDAEQLVRRVLAIQADHRAARLALADILTASGRTAEAQSIREI